MSTDTMNHRKDLHLKIIVNSLWFNCVFPDQRFNYCVFVLLWADYESSKETDWLQMSLCHNKFCIHLQPKVFFSLHCQTNWVELFGVRWEKQDVENHFHEQSVLSHQPAPTHSLIQHSVSPADVCHILQLIGDSKDRAVKPGELCRGLNWPLCFYNTTAQLCRKKTVTSSKSGLFLSKFNYIWHQSFSTTSVHLVVSWI